MVETANCYSLDAMHGLGLEWMNIVAHMVFLALGCVLDMIGHLLVSSAPLILALLLTS